MTNKNELNELELNKISGGVLLNEKYKEYNNEINKYDTENYIGQDLYFDCSVPNDVMSSRYEYIYGTLLRSYERSNGCGTTKRTATVKVIDSNTYSIGDTEDISLDNWSTYSR